MSAVFDAAVSSMVGALDLAADENGVTPFRLPAWTRPQIVDPGMGLVVSVPAGVRLEAETDAAWIELDVQLTLLQMGETLLPAVFDLVVDGTLVESVSSTDGIRIVLDLATGGFDFRMGGPTTIRFDALPARADAVVEVWFPHAAGMQLRDVRVPDGAELRPANRQRPLWVHYGSSISHCVEAERPTETWPSIAGRLAGVSVQNMGFAGQCQLDQTVARTIRDLAADAISMKVGINVLNGDTMRERTFVPALHGFLDTVRDGHPTTPLVVCTPIFCPSGETNPGPTLMRISGKFETVARPPELAAGALSLQRMRELIAMVVEARRSAGDLNLHLMSGLDLFGADEAADLPDDLHPNPAGYRRMGERFHRMAFTGTGPFAHLAARAEG